MQTVTEIENKTRHPVTLTHRRSTDRTSSIGTKEFETREIVLSPGINTLDDFDTRLVRELRERHPGTKRRFQEGELLIRDRRMTKSELEEAIRRCGDPITLRRWRESTQDKALLSLIEDQLAASTVTTDGDSVAKDVKRDPKDPRKGGV